MSDLVVTLESGTGVIRFNRPAKKNALTESMLSQIPTAARDFVDGGAHSLIICGSSEVFSAGADLAEVAEPEQGVAIQRELEQAAQSIADVPIPTIAAIEGPCLGAAVELSLACDVRVAGQSAFFMIPAARFGIVYRAGGVERISREAGLRVARRLLLLNETLGPVDVGAKVVLDGQAGEVAKSLARHVGTLDRDAVAAMKRFLGSAS